MPNKYFGSERQVKAHLLRAKGLAGEVLDLRDDVQRAFDAIAADVSGGGGGKFIFDPGATQNGPVYGDWAELMAVIASLPHGFNPTITFMANFTIPLTGMPVDGWNQNEGYWYADILATGGTVVTISDGVKIANLSRISNGLVVNGTSSSSVFEFTQHTALGDPWVMVVGEGAALFNTGTAPMIVSPGVPGVQRYVVLSFNLASTRVGPPGTAPYAEMFGEDVFVCNQFNPGYYGAPYDDFVTTTSPTATLVYQIGVDATLPTLNHWAGNPPLVFNGAKAEFLTYDDTVQAPPIGETNVQAALDHFKSCAGRSATLVYRPGVASAGPVVFDDWAALWAACLLLEGPVDIQIDNTIVSPAVMPAGTYDMAQVTLRGMLDAAVPTALLLEDGVVIQNIRTIMDVLEVTAEATTTPAFTLESGSILVLGRGVTIKSGNKTGLVPAVVANDGAAGASIIVMYIGSSIGSGQNDVRVDALVDGLMVVVLEGMGEIPDQSFVGLGVLQLLLFGPSALVGFSALPPSQPGVGTFVVYNPKGSKGGSKESSFVETLSLAAPKTFLPLGYALTSTILSPGRLVIDGDTLGTLVVEVTGGGAANTGLTLTVEVEVAGVPVPGSQVVVDAETGGFLVASFLVGLNPGNVWCLSATASAPLAAPVTAIRCTLL